MAAGLSQSQGQLVVRPHVGDAVRESRLLFTPSQERPWSNVRRDAWAAYATGWATTGETFLSGESLGRYVVDKLSRSLTLSEILGGLYGNFSIVAEGANVICLGVDVTRSIPLFYRSAGASLKVSDDIRQVREEADTCEEESAIEYSTAGFVTGPYTLFRGVAGLQSGECVSLVSGDTTPNAQRYYRYSCSYDAGSSAEELCEELDQVTHAAFNDIIQTLNGRQVAVPLSGGLDSRFVVSMLRRCGYDNVLCFSYGVPGNKEAARARIVAETLGYRWIEVPYSGDLWRQSIVDPEMRKYWRFSANGVSVPHCDEWPAIRALRDRHEVSDEAIFMPGHTGDFTSGGHLKYLFDPLFHDAPREFTEAMVKKHYSLWEDLLALDGVREAIENRLHEALEGFSSETDEDLARMYEHWEWQERQAKLIINAVRVYEFFGYSWRIPLWHRSLMDFWRRVPLTLKMDKYLYRRYLGTGELRALFPDDAPSSLWHRDRARPRGIRSSVKAALRFVWPFAPLLHRFETHRRHLYNYRNHPLGFASAYGPVRYVFREPSKRHGLSLLLREFLQAEYGLDISARRSAHPRFPKRDSSFP